MISRSLTLHLIEAAKQLPVVALLGPRQSGKTTLARATFKDHIYISLEDLDTRKFAQEDPRRFFFENRNEHGIILDEFQHVPELLSYIQTQVDTEDIPGYFILTGSQNFLLNQAISQTLAGRIALLYLLPLSISELKAKELLPEKVDSLIFKGQYPRVYARNLNPATWYRDYIATYLERDVRQLAAISDLSRFHYFIQLCAGRVGQLLNVSSLATDCGIDVRTAKSWLSLLEASYIIFLLQPHYKNFSKRLIKSPKIYFYDTAIACSLLGIESEQQLQNHYLKGNLFECLITSDLIKHFYNANRRPQLYFWRDNHGHEVDCIIEKAMQLIPIEIKLSMTISSSLFEGLKYWKEISDNIYPKAYLVYGGFQDQERAQATVVSWQNIEKIFSD
ncbi:ATP-binding protein [Candidatus Dependentiae bacterium]|nr:ATP-binding protein [Candidatus Dependentiae bacterium]